MARKLADAHGLGPSEVVFSRSVIDELQANQFVIQQAVADIRRDLANGVADPDQALEWLVKCLEPFLRTRIEPHTGADPQGRS
ncbi:MAG: hypothetical protein KAZ88_00950 [Acidimicrobiia bacterium]|jgi:methionine salvage enolase-phosphatase E1|nr:hypothetical protein [Acidimicrobiia bacterium]MBP8179543.1 hypothetical protein [Acidimicrobiia bacterium]